MRKLSGNITSSGKQEIPKGAVAIISVVDCGRMDAPSITLGKVEIKEPKGFPLHYELEYDDSFLRAQQFHGQYAVQARIETKGQLNFVNDTRFNIVSDHQNKKLLDKLDFHVISV